MTRHPADIKQDYAEGRRYGMKGAVIKIIIKIVLPL